MHSHRELTALAAHKSRLRRRIALRRRECLQAAEVALQPLGWLDEAVARWHQISPLLKVALPIGLLVNRMRKPSPGFLGTLVRWAPLAFSAIRGMSGHRRGADGE